MVREPFRFNMPTRPGQVPLQLATVRIGTAMGGQAGQYVMAVLPDALGDNQRGAGVQLAEHLDAHFLGVNEAVLLLLVEGMGANDGPAFGFQGPGEERLPSSACAGQHCWLAESRRSPLDIR